MWFTNVSLTTLIPFSLTLSDGHTGGCALELRLLDAEAAGEPWPIRAVRGAPQPHALLHQPCQEHGHRLQTGLWSTFFSLFYSWEHVNISLFLSSKVID